ncbi:rRNA-processing protein FCF1, putative [Eimeria acervulina]|uniref:rRNA-processing protein FCF1, putative n=1 Tax=Eimeria acervulina TaxID=5801 RepID=U6GI99_EIMAC|nr:rRNA-processing protein FCF1, putative [Eimeria acervulina]CDI78309.1 rRNA-processing protein FCF1, putative [Eimeria acervulina]
MGKARKTRKFAAVKRTINPKDQRLQNKEVKKLKKRKERETALKEHVQHNPDQFFSYNTNLVPPYQVLVDTNFINGAIQTKQDVLQGLITCLVAKLAELEKLGHRYRLALHLAKDPRIKRLKCLHAGTYADDCIVQRVTEHKCYLVATNDKDLKRRIRKIPGVPIVYLKGRTFAVERLPEAITALPAAKSAFPKN